MSDQPTLEELEAQATAAAKTAMAVTDCLLCQAVWVTLQATAGAGAARATVQEIAAAADISPTDAADAHVAKAALLFAVATFKRLFPRTPGAFVDVLHQTLQQCGVTVVRATAVTVATPPGDDDEPERTH